MDTGGWLKASVYMTLPSASNPIINTWVFRCVAASDANSLSAIGLYINAALVEKYYTPLSTSLVTALRLLKIELRDLANPAEGFDQILDTPLGAVGVSSMPAFVTFSIREQRTLFSIRNGRKAISGVPSAGTCDAGGEMLTTIREATNEILAENWEGAMEVETLGGAEYTFENVIARLPAVGGPPVIWSPISAYTVTGFGTQNSRK